MLTELKAGWTYVSGFLPVRTILLLFAVVSLMGMPFVVLMPIFAARVLHGGPHTLGFLMGAMGVGALISALSLAARKSVRGLVRMIPIAAAVFGLGLIGFGLSHVFWLSMVMVLVAGMGMMQGMAASNTIIQTMVSEDKRGRVMSYYTMAFMGMAPFGSLLAGTMASAVGAPWTVIVNGSVVLLGAAWFFTRLPAIRAVIRPIYRRWDSYLQGGSSVVSRIRSGSTHNTPPLWLSICKRELSTMPGGPRHSKPASSPAGHACSPPPVRPERNQSSSMWADRSMEATVCKTPVDAADARQETLPPDWIEFIPELDRQPGDLVDSQTPVGRLLRHGPRLATAPPRPEHNRAVRHSHRSWRGEHGTRRLRTRLRDHLRRRMP